MMIKITDYLPADKLLHLQGGLIIAMVVTPLLGDPIAGFCVAMAAGIVKEWVVDGWMLKGNFEAWDFFATAGGGIVGGGIAYALPLIGKIV
jgi:hypothetical protein